MSILVKDGRVPVTVDNKSFIYIREKLDVGTRNKLRGVAYRVRDIESAESAHAEVELGDFNNACLVQCIVAWEGPDFEEEGKPLPCNATNILRLPDDHLLVEKALEEIGRLHTRNLLFGDSGTRKNGASPNPKLKKSAKTGS